MYTDTDTNHIRSEYYENDMDEVKILPGNVEEDDSDEEMAEHFGY